MAGVEAVTISTSVPLFGGGLGRTVFRDGQDPKDPRNGRMTQVNQVSGSYFDTTKHPDREGPRHHRRPTARAATPVAVINEAMAAQLWPNEDPLGRTRAALRHRHAVADRRRGPHHQIQLHRRGADGLPLPAARAEPRLAGRGAGARVGRSDAGAGHGAARAAAARTRTAAAEREHLRRRCCGSRCGRRAWRRGCSASSPGWRCCWRPSGSTACSPIRSRSARASWASAWRWARATPTCAAWWCARAWCWPSPASCPACWCRGSCRAPSRACSTACRPATR